MEPIVRRIMQDLTNECYLVSTRIIDELKYYLNVRDFTLNPLSLKPRIKL